MPRLQARFQPALAALILGVLWCLWHAPLFLTREWDTPRSNAGDLLAYLVFVVSLSFVLAWLTNAARGSVFLAMLGHNSVNWTLVALLLSLSDGPRRPSGPPPPGPRSWP